MSHKTHDHLELPGLGRANQCQAEFDHNPAPVRFVWHHILPEVCGGASDAENVIMLCDNCHYLIHALLWLLKRDGDLKAAGRHGNLLHRELAFKGYTLANQAQVAAWIPNEGSIFE